MPSHAHFWNHVLACRDTIACIDRNSEDATQRLVACLGTLGEAFKGDFDPADDFEAYVTLACCQAISETLSATQGVIGNRSTNQGLQPRGAAPEQRGRAENTFRD